jgi:hypothetical protein
MKSKFILINRGVGVLLLLFYMRWVMDYQEAIEAIKNNWPDERYTVLREALNLAIKTMDGINGETSDGYHTFDELYYHRMILFSVICNTHKSTSWKSWKHADGTMYDDYFIVGIQTPKGPYTYHYHKDYWDIFKLGILPYAPPWDGHKPEDITRLLSLCGWRKKND